MLSCQGSAHACTEQQHDIPVLAPSSHPDKCRAWFEGALQHALVPTDEDKNEDEDEDDGDGMAAGLGRHMCLLKPSRRFAFAHPHARLLELWKAWGALVPGVPIDLVYFPVLLDALVSAVAAAPLDSAHLVLYHCGGLEGVPSMLSRYNKD